MSDYLVIQPFSVQLRRILKEYEATQSIFGIHKSLFYTPEAGRALCRARLFTASTWPRRSGPSAGPHTQLSQNIVASWLCGGRFIELKTVQILDELEIPRPCIDMEDEGYNVEWSQELKLEESAQEYINALGADPHPARGCWAGRARAPVGTIFDMSVGYNLEGIKSPRMTRFMDKMADAVRGAGADPGDPAARDSRSLPTSRSPPESPTASPSPPCTAARPTRSSASRVSAERARAAHHRQDEPDSAGQRASARHPARRPGLRQRSTSRTRCSSTISEYDRGAGADPPPAGRRRAHRSLAFGVKLSNTLAMHNHKQIMPGDEMYMSGRALYPVTMNLFDKLAHEFDGNLRVSYSAGADALNIATILSCGAGAGDRLLRPAQAGRLRPLRPMAGEPGSGDGEQRREQPGRVLGEQAGEPVVPRPQMRWPIRATRRSTCPSACPR